MKNANRRPSLWLKSALQEFQPWILADASHEIDASKPGRGVVNTVVRSLRHAPLPTDAACPLAPHAPFSGRRLSHSAAHSLVLVVFRAPKSGSIQDLEVQCACLTLR